MRIQDLKDNSYSFTIDDINNCPEPTFTYSVGSIVTIGRACRTVRVVGVTEDFKAYYVKPYQSEAKEGWEWWYNLRPVVDDENVDSFHCEDDIRFNYMSTTIAELVGRVFHAGVELNPPYQRDLVWTVENKEALIDSIFNNIDIGKFTFIQHDFSCSGACYEILDGKQRLTTLVDFYLNKFPFKGRYYNDLCKKDKSWFNNYNVSSASLEYLTQKQKYRLFLMLNKGGVTMDKAHLEAIEREYNNLK